ncbi:amino acid adenylation domain-containing protein, partial [Corallococcus exercitus]
MSDLLKRLAGLSPEKQALLLKKLRSTTTAVPNTPARQQSLPPLGRRPQGTKAPLSFAQQRLWFLEQLEPDTARYNIPSAVRLQGPLDVAVLERAFEALGNRHESLRTTFRQDAEADSAEQVISTVQPLRMQVVDLSLIPPEQRQPEVLRRAQAEAGRPFNLVTGPLFRASLLRLDAEEHVLVLCMHHIVSDGWSTAVFVREMGTLYAAFLQGHPSPLPELPLQYADYAVWQRAWLRDEELERQLSYWRQQLADAPALLKLPTDRPRPAEQSFRGAGHPVLLSRQLSDALKAFAQREGVTPFMLLLATFQLLLSRYAGQDDVSVGSSIAGRRLAELEGLIGFFANTLVMRTRLDGDPSFRALLQRVRETTLGAYAHQDIPFEKLVEEFKPERNLAYNPFFQVLFTVLNTPVSKLSVSGLTLRLLELETTVSKFDLELAFTESDGSLQGLFVYNSDLFDAATIARMATQLQTLLEDVLARPDARLSELELLPPSERQHLLRDWNEARRELPEVPLVHRLFEAQVARTPDATALCFGAESLTYAQLNARANQLARHLRRVGVRSEVLVALCLDRSFDFVIALLATLKAGGAFLPLDPHLPSERLDFIITDAVAAVLLTHSSVDHPLDRHGYVLRLDEDEAHFAREPKHDLDFTPDALSLAYVIYTSGSTGRPKGALLQHRGLCNTALQTVDFMDLRPGCRLLQFFSPGFDASVSEIIPALLSGATLVLASREELMPGAPLVDLVREQSITTLKLTPTVLAQLQPEELAGVRTLIVAGEACTPELVERFAPGRRFVNAYGPTEATVCATVNTALRPDRVTLGRPFHNVQAYVLDAWLRPLPIGVPGELYLGGVGLARGYLGRPDLTAERFVPNPFSSEPGARLYRTGDKARWLPHGELESLGRLDFQVKLRGFRIELGEVETVLSLHPHVRACVVLLREDSPGHRRLVAYAVAADSEAPPDVDSLRSWLKEKLPDYMVPASFVLLEALPLSSSGKVDRGALPPPEASSQLQATAYVAPRDEVEQQLADIWSRVLGREQVGIHDNFFELGGDSIISLQVVARARQAGLLLTTRHLFQHQTVARLAPVVQVISRAASEQGAVTGPVPLTPIQQHLFQHDAAHAHHYNHALLLTPLHPREPALFEQALQHLVAHHDALRLRFFQHEGRWLQENASVEEAPLQLLRKDLSTLPSGEQAAALEAEATRLQASFVLSKPPLLRAALFELGNGQQRLLIIVNHLVVDVVSWRVLLEDLETICLQLLRSEPPSLPSKSTSFQSWARRLQAHGHSVALAAEAPLWLEEGRAHVAPLPLEAAGENLRSSERTHAIAFDAEETRLLLQEVPTAWRARINDVLLTALAQALAEWTGHSDVRVHLEGHGREELFADVDTSRTVGWFTSLVPVLLRVPADGGTGTRLRAIRDSLLRLPHHGIGHGLLKWMGPEALSQSLHSQPPPQVAFNYTGQFDTTATSSQLFVRASEATGPSLDPSGTRFHVLEVNGNVQQGQLRFLFSYSERLHSEATIATLASRFQHHLRALITERHSEDARRFSPGDFPLASPVSYT